MVEDTRGGISISKVKKLELKSDWRQWSRDIDAWILDRDYDEEAPTVPPGVGTRAAHAVGGAVEHYWAALSIWERNQKKACNGITHACGTRAYQLAKELTPDRIAILTKLEEEFKPSGEALFHELDAEYMELNLGNYQGVEEYITAFDSSIVKLKEIGDDRTTNAPSCIKHFISGLGTAFSSWEQSFNQQHQYFGANPTTLAEAQASASTESFRLKKSEKSGDRLALLSARLDTVVAMNTQLLTEKNSNGKRPRKDSEKKAAHICVKCSKFPGLDSRHTPEKCWLDFPHLKTEWESRNPQRAKARTARLLAERHVDPTARLATIENSPEPTAVARIAHLAVRGLANRGNNL